jgi:hypothetical protein
MLARVFSPFFVIALIYAGAARATEEAQPENPRYGVPTPADVTPEQQTQILAAFKAREPALRKYALTFQAARFSMVRVDPNDSRITIASTLELGRYAVSLVFTGTFDKDFETLLKSRCDLFGAYDNNHELKPGQRRRPLVLEIEDMDRFCESPNDFLQQAFADAAKH